MVSLRRFLHSPRARRGLAASIVVLATGGLVLARTDSGRASLGFAQAAGDGRATFSGPGATGSLALSHSRVLSSGEQTVFAELRLKADERRSADEERAPIALAIVIDTSGSMSGDKIVTSKRSVIQLIRSMRDDDEVAVVRYDSASEVIQPLAPVARVRSELIERVQELSAGGGTDIAPALTWGVDALARARPGRVRRVVLASDGLDSNRARSERVARDALDRRITVSALGIGLDFDESYLSAVANAGRGNFAFVENGSALAKFLSRELDETANTVVESARARLSLPQGTRFVRAVGAEVERAGDRDVELVLGSLFSGDERRVIVELAVRAEHGEVLPLEADVDWQLVGGNRASARISELSMLGERDEREVARAKNGAVYANAISATASLRQLAAAEAYARGDERTAQQLIQENQASLAAAAQAAPEAEAESLRRQLDDVTAAQTEFAKAPPRSPGGKAAAKAAAASNVKNLSRPAF